LSRWREALYSVLGKMLRYFEMRSVVEAGTCVIRTKMGILGSENAFLPRLAARAVLLG
jgi:hypothetical protein